MRLIVISIFIASTLLIPALSLAENEDTSVLEETARQILELPEKAAEVATETLKVPIKLVEGILAFDLGKLIVAPTKYEKLLGDTTVSASVIDTDDFKKGVFYDVSEPLDRVNSVRIERYGSPGQVASPVIRGMTTNRILVLIDGTPYNSPSLGGADLSKISLAKVKRIEVVRGPYSSLYGADAVGGIINIITKDVPKETRVDTSYSFGSWNTHNVTIENGSTFGKVGYNVVANYIFTDGERIHSDHSAFDVATKVSADILDDIRYSFYTNYYVARTENPGARPARDVVIRTPTQNILGNEDSSSLFDRSRTNRLHLNSVLNIKNFTANHYFMYWNDDSHRETISFNNNSDRLIDNDEYMTYIYGMEYKYVQPIMDIDTITIGASFSRKVFKVKTHQFNDRAITHTFGGRDAVRREWALYGENEFKLYPFTVVCGLRYDDPSDYTTRLSPKISGMLDLGFDTKVRASYARAYRAPTLNDINWPQDAYSEGNATLRPEKTESWEIGVEKLFGDSALVRATYFKQRILNAIAWAPVGTRVNLGWGSYARWTPTNFNKLSTKGVELETKFKILKDIHLYLDYTYLEPEEVITAQRDYNNDTLLNESRRLASHIPRHKVYGGLECGNLCGIKGLTLDSSLRYVSGRRNYYARYATWPDTSISYPKKVLAHYFLWDAKLSYIRDNVEFFVAFDNILDTGYSKFGSTMTDRDYPQSGFSVVGGARATY